MRFCIITCVFILIQNIQTSGKFCSFGRFPLGPQFLLYLIWYFGTKLFYLGYILLIIQLIRETLELGFIINWKMPIVALNSAAVFEDVEFCAMLSTWEEGLGNTYWHLLYPGCMSLSCFRFLKFLWQVALYASTFNLLFSPKKSTETSPRQEIVTAQC